jgi:hypothetical protein
MPADDPDTDTSDLAREVIKELDPGTVIDDKLILSRRQALAIATGTVSASALLGFATGTAEADASGQVGTSSDPVEVFAYSLQDRTGETAFLTVAASGSVQLSSGSATVTANASHSSGSTYYLALGTTENAKISGRVFNDGDLKVELLESGTSVGNPTVEYAVLQVS